ncbi:MAG: PAS domain-containing protein [Alphaproteobacteria bacterium]|nr:PAS domain-containing protein [Alphaproteobacteria bacterium]MDX5369338.1 PAS domain-containing protein [Alphaproteobacteria bacterium]MDX5464019.1 PAS domain-containing protein [Alphaproteobacteria bacterium]
MTDTRERAGKGVGTLLRIGLPVAALAAAGAAAIVLPPLIVPVPAPILLVTLALAVGGGYLLRPRAVPEEAAGPAPAPASRIDRLASAARALSEGHLDVRLPKGGNDTASVIAEALDTLAQAIRAEQATRDHLANIVDHLDVAVLLLEPDGRVRQVNSAALSLFERDVETVLGGSIFGLLDGEADTGGATEVTERLGERATVVRPSGDLVPVTAHAVAIDGPDGREIVCALRNIAAETARLDAIEAAHGELEALQRMKAQFLDNMSHELRTPLNAVIGLSEMFVNQIFGPLGNEKYVTYAAKINESGAHLLSLLNDILQIAKIDGGSETLVIEEVSPMELAHSAVALVEDRAWEKGVALGFMHDEVLPETIEADVAAAKTMLVHLLKNAVQHTPSGGAATVMVEADDTHVTFVVEDMGQGMPKDVIEDALTPFRQVNAGHNRRAKDGAGLGLPLAKRIAELHGGSFGIESEPEQFTRVRVRLPVARPKQRSQAQAA